MASTAGDGKTEPDAGDAAATPVPPVAGEARPAADVEHATMPETAVDTVLRRWRREDLLDKGTLVLRALAWLFSALAFVVMASNNHGDWKNYEKYEPYRYLVAISILAFLYTTGQVIRRVMLLAGRRDALSRRTSAYLGFFGDQVTAYLLISASSAAITLTNQMREVNDNIFTDQSSASISMAFCAFIALALSAMLSGFKLSNHSYI